MFRKKLTLTLTVPREKPLEYNEVEWGESRPHLVAKAETTKTYTISLQMPLGIGLEDASDLVDDMWQYLKEAASCKPTA